MSRLARTTKTAVQMDWVYGCFVPIKLQAVKTRHKKEELMWKTRVLIALQYEKFERNYIERRYEAINPAVQQGDQS